MDIIRYFIHPILLVLLVLGVTFLENYYMKKRNFKVHALANYVDGGFGVEANSRGRACYGWSLYTGEKCRIERPDVIGIVPEEKMPDFAKNTLERILKEQKRKREERDAR